MIPHIMDIFRGAPINPQSTGGPAHGNTAPNGVIPPPAENNPNPAPENKSQEKKEAAPLEKFTSLWEPLTAEELAKRATPSGVDFENVDATKMMEAARKVDFGQILTPEMQAEIAKGGEEGVKATIAAMNSVAQLTYGQSALAASKMIGAAVKQARTEISSQIPDLVKAAVVSSNLAKANPLFQNPAVKPIVDGLKDQLLIKFPGSTDAQLTQMAQDYFLEVSKGFAPAASSTSTADPKKKNMTGKGEEDWETFFKT